MSVVGADAPLCAACERRHGHHLTCERAVEIHSAIAGLDSISRAFEQDRLEEVGRLHYQIAGLKTVLAVLRHAVGNAVVDEVIVSTVAIGVTLPSEVLVGVTALDGSPASSADR